MLQFYLILEEEAFVISCFRNFVGIIFHRHAHWYDTTILQKQTLKQGVPWNS